MDYDYLYSKRTRVCNNTIKSQRSSLTPLVFRPIRLYVDESNLYRVPTITSYCLIFRQTHGTIESIIIGIQLIITRQHVVRLYLCV